MKNNKMIWMESKKKRFFCCWKQICWICRLSIFK